MYIQRAIDRKRNTINDCLNCDKTFAATVDKLGFVRLEQVYQLIIELLKLELTENCPKPTGNVERFVKVKSITLEKDVPVDNEMPSETMNKLALESRLSGTLKLKPLDDKKHTPKNDITLSIRFNRHTRNGRLRSSIRDRNNVKR